MRVVEDCVLIAKYYEPDDNGYTKANLHKQIDREDECTLNVYVIDDDTIGIEDDEDNEEYTYDDYLELYVYKWKKVMVRPDNHGTSSIKGFVFIKPLKIEA
jgi:hypothetical protein